MAAASKDIEWARISSDDTNYSFKGIADILESEGWDTVSEVISLEELKEQEDNYEEMD